MTKRSLVASMAKQIPTFNKAAIQEVTGLPCDRPEVPLAVRQDRLALDHIIPGNKTIRASKVYSHPDIVQNFHDLRGGPVITQRVQLEAKIHVIRVWKKFTLDILNAGKKKRKGKAPLEEVPTTSSPTMQLEESRSPKKVACNQEVQMAISEWNGVIASRDLMNKVNDPNHGMTKETKDACEQVYEAKQKFEFIEDFCNVWLVDMTSEEDTHKCFVMSFEKDIPPALTVSCILVCGPVGENSKPVIPLPETVLITSNVLFTVISYDLNIIFLLRRSEYTSLFSKLGSQSLNSIALNVIGFEVIPVADIIRVRTGERGFKAERMAGGRSELLSVAYQEEKNDCEGNVVHGVAQTLLVRKSETLLQGDHEFTTCMPKATVPHHATAFVGMYCRGFSHQKTSIPNVSRIS
eukprot:Gb_31235 [translate_table: standard]